MMYAQSRWRCERLAVLLQTESREDAIVMVEAEARSQPWLDDPRPAPERLEGGYVGED